MAEPIEDKTFLAERLEEDRHRLELLARETKEYYNVAAHFRASVAKHSWRCISGALLAGFLLPLLVTRRSRANRSPAHFEQETPRKRKLDLWQTVVGLINQVIVLLQQELTERSKQSPFTILR
jgi:hypothetical protein